MKVVGANEVYTPNQLSLKLFIAPTGPPQDVQVSVINSRQINVTWSGTIAEYTNGIIRHFVINVTQDTGDVQQLTISSQQLYHVVRNLQPHTNYSISVAAVTIDRGPFSSEIHVEMPESGRVNNLFDSHEKLCFLAAPTLPPANISVEIVSSRQVFVSWIPPEMNARNGVIRRYIINLTRVDRNDPSSMTSDVTSITLPVLPFRRYLISVAAVTVETGPFSDDTEFETPEDGKQPTSAKRLVKF